MDIGRLNRRVDILVFQKERDEYGGEIGKWIKYKTVWAHVAPISGTEVFRSQQVDAQNVTTITIRYRKDVTVLNRIKYLDKTYEIIGNPDVNSDHKMMRLNCKEIVSYGV